MALGYDGKLYILAFDHRGSFQKKMFGIPGDPTPEETETIADAKRLIFEGMLEAVREGAEAGATGVLVDEQFGSNIPEQAREHGLKLAMPVEKSGQDDFDFEYGDDFPAPHREVQPGLLQGARPLQPGRPTPRMNREQLDAAEAAGRLAPRERPQVPVRAARAGHRRAARLRRRRQRPLRRRAAAGADAPGDRGAPELRASRSTSGRSRASTSAPTPRCSPSRPGPARVARASRASCSVAERRPRRSSSGSRRRRRWRASSGSRSGARSGGTRSRASSNRGARPRGRGQADRR